MGKFMQGVFKPAHPEKYKGDVKNIIYRSSWELTYLMKLDRDENVIQYASEEVIIPYHHPVSHTVRRYFVDFWVKRKVGDQIVIDLIEIKPLAQTRPPVIKKGQNKKTAINQGLTYLINEAKWQAADKYCNKKGWNFIILTEKEIGR